jgi:hypothetical protein
VSPADQLDVLLDAYDGVDHVTGTADGDVAAWSLTRPSLPSGRALVPTPPDPKDASSPKVGWGLVLPEIPGATLDEQATAADAPEPIQRLLAHRRGKVLRYRPGVGGGAALLRDPGAQADIALISPPTGTGPQELPKYLLIYGPPAEIPWSLQFTLNTMRCVGRLDLTGDALDRYVSAAIEGWPDSAAAYRAPVVWSVDHGGGLDRDMTTLMRRTVAVPLKTAFAGDADMPALTYLDGSTKPALVGELTGALSVNSPAFVVTTSHGMTGPIGDHSALLAKLGCLVDQHHQVLDPSALLGSWQPDGAVWFAQACCSAGSNGPSVYQGLFDAEGEVGEVLYGVAAAGAAIAPLPRALLGAEKPLRAFIGRVEPTFSWTLRDQLTGAALTADLVSTVYERLCAANPVGMAMEPFFAPVGTLLQQLGKATAAANDEMGDAAAAARQRALYLKVTAFDRAGLVILGDPAVAVPTPSAASHRRPNG